MKKVGKRKTTAMKSSDAFFPFTRYLCNEWKIFKEFETDESQSVGEAVYLSETEWKNILIIGTTLDG